MNVLSIIKYISSHPLNQGGKLRAIKRFLHWQVTSAILHRPVILPFVEDTVLAVEKGMTGATGNIYNGLHEYQEMLFVLHFLREGDLFVDVGANIGSYTVLASGVCRARTISFEPVPATYSKLKRNVLLNDISELATTVNMAAGSKETSLIFSDGLDTVNHALTKGEKERGVSHCTIECTSLDAYVEDEPILFKIDVEGFETEVLRGSRRLLQSDGLKGIIIELNGSGGRYGFNETEIHNDLLSHGFSPYIYNPFERALIRTEKWGTHNTIYLRDIDEVARRIKGARKIEVNGKSY